MKTLQATKQQGFGSTVPHKYLLWNKPSCSYYTCAQTAEPPYPLWRWKEEEDVTGNPENSRITASCSSLPVFHTSDQCTTSSTPSPVWWHPQAQLVAACLVDYLVFCLFCDFCLWFTEVRGGGRGRSCGVGENRGTDIGMPQAVSLLPFLLALMGYGECRQTVLITWLHVWKAWQDHWFLIHPIRPG